MDSEEIDFTPRHRRRLLAMVGALAALSPVERAQRLRADEPPAPRGTMASTQRARRKAKRKQAERSRRRNRGR